MAKLTEQVLFCMDAWDHERPDNRPGWYTAKQIADEIGQPISSVHACLSSMMVKTKQWVEMNFGPPPLCEKAYQVTNKGRIAAWKLVEDDDTPVVALFKANERIEPVVVYELSSGDPVKMLDQSRTQAMAYAAHEVGPGAYDMLLPNGELERFSVATPGIDYPWYRHRVLGLSIDTWSWITLIAGLMFLVWAAMYTGSHEPWVGRPK